MNIELTKEEAVEFLTILENVGERLREGYLKCDPVADWEVFKYYQDKVPLLNRVIECVKQNIFKDKEPGEL